MAHIHLPDGVFPIQWVVFWWLLALPLLSVALVVTRRRTIPTQQLVIDEAVVTGFVVDYLSKVRLDLLLR